MTVTHRRATRSPGSVHHPAGRNSLERGIINGQLKPEADIAIAATFPTGSCYSSAISGAKPPRDWAPRTAALIWLACRV